jgi:LysR family glycine cleavage system transcriptional activator
MAAQPYNALRAFEAVIRLGSVRAAADELFVTQSAVSHLLRQLEKTLGVSLFESGGRRLRPTEAGERLALGLRDGFLRIHAAVEHVSSHRRSRRINLACMPSVAIRWLVPKMIAFRQLHPDIHMRLHYSTTLPSAHVMSGTDLLITALDGHYQGPGTAWRLMDGATFPVSSPLYLDRVGNLSEPADLLSVDLLHDEATASWYTWFRSHGLPEPSTNNPMIYEDFSLMSGALIAGQGVALAPRLLITEELKGGLLIPLFDSPGNIDRAYWIVCPGGPRPEDLAFVDWALSQPRGLDDGSVDSAD